jgi:transcriptional regulator with XRE-family HTH domain
MANNLRTIRQRLGLTQAQVATAMGTTVNQYGKLERDKHGRQLTDKWINRAAAAFRVDPGEIVTERPTLFIGPQGMAFAVIPQTLGDLLLSHTRSVILCE